MDTRVLQQEEIDTYVPVIKDKLNEYNRHHVSDNQIQSVLNEYLEVAELYPEDYQNKSIELIVDEIVQEIIREKFPMAAGRRRSKQSKKRSATRRRRSSKRKSRKINKRRK
jgi:hypothetical protein